MKPLASLTSSLLARKGQAKPAMRPQAFAGFDPARDDLGWNDMGEAVIAAPEPPPVVRQQEALAAAVAAPRPRAPASPAGTDKAAFTLRLDGERHLRLRIASAVSRLSSQQLVTKALDQFLEAMPELDDLVARAKTDPRSNFRA